jgi:RNA polymerase sigma factor (sigma-70 family)
MSAFGTRSTHDVFMASLSGSSRDQGVFLKDNEALIFKVIRRYAYAHEWMDDLYQEASIGVLKALAKFDVNRGLNFSTYALPWMKVYVERFIQANMCIVSMPTRTQEIAYRVRAMSTVKTNIEIAKELQISIESVCALSQIHQHDNDISGASDSTSPEDYVTRQRLLDKVSEAYDKLGKSQQDIVGVALDLDPNYDSVSSYGRENGLSRNLFNKTAKAGIALLQVACD